MTPLSLAGTAITKSDRERPKPPQSRGNKGKEMSEHLKAFLAAYLGWVDAGAVEDGCFMRGTGLCNNFEYWLAERGIGLSDAEYEIHLLSKQFKSEGLDQHYPFGGEDAYDEAMVKGEQHLNAARIAWVRSKVAQHEVA
jgi:hypothetical protein